MCRRVVSAVLLSLGIACDRGKKQDIPPSSSAAVAPTHVVVSAEASVDVLSHASETPDDGGGRGAWTARSPDAAPADGVEGDALRAKNVARLKRPVPVTVLVGTSARELGERLCNAVVPARAPETPILLKPNLGGFDWFKDPATHGGDDGLKGRITDPEFVRGVVRCLKARGHTKITIAEGWGATHKDWVRLVQTSGYEAMAREESVPLLAMDDDGVFDHDSAESGKPLALRGMEKTRVPTLLIPKLLADHLEHGMFISLPKIKAHRFGVVSMSIKGMQGTVMLSDAMPAFRQKWRMHRELGAWLAAKAKGQPADRATYVAALEIFAERIADVLEIEAPDVVLAEGSPAMGGDGFQKMTPSAENVAIGGTNPILVDRVGAQFLGLWDNAALAKELGGHATSPLIEVAAKRFALDLTAPEVIGDGASLLRAPRPTHFVGMAGFTIDTEAPPAPTAHAARLDGEPPVIDGTPSDAAWGKAVPLAWDTDFAGAQSGILTRARFLWSKDALYVLFELSSAGLAVDASRSIAIERPKLYEEDCVELFFTPDPARTSHYYEVELGPLGHFFDIDVERGGQGVRPSQDTAWSSGARIGTTHDAALHTAIIEASLRAPEITRALTASARLPIGLYRIEGRSPRVYLAFSPPRTKSPNFHVPAAFGALILDP